MPNTYECTSCGGDLRGPRTLVELGAYCVACGKKQPTCPCPPDHRLIVDSPRGRSNTCKWCRKP